MLKKYTKKQNSKGTNCLLELEKHFKELSYRELVLKK